MLWDDDAEGGDSLCLVLMEREAAAAYSQMKVAKHVSPVPRKAAIVLYVPVP